MLFLKSNSNFIISVGKIEKNIILRSLNKSTKNGLIYDTTELWVKYDKLHAQNVQKRK